MMGEDFKITMSPTVGAIAAALVKAQLVMRPALKDADNPHFKSRFASLGSNIEACRPLLENGIAVLQPTMLSGPDGVAVATLLIHTSGEWIRGELYMPASKKDPQGFGSALSYARRYCLSSTINNSSDDDDGEAAAKMAPSLEKQLAASIDWAKWTKTQEASLRNAKSLGALNEAWGVVYAERDRTPNGTQKRLGAIKDECKAKLSQPEQRA